MRVLRDGDLFDLLGVILSAKCGYYHVDLGANKFAHFRGRVMNNVRAKLVNAYGREPHHIIAAAHPNTAAKCNLNKCSPKMFAKAQAEGFPPFSVTAHFAEMTRSTFCLVPVGDSPPSSRLYLAVSAGCIPVFISDSFVGAFPHEVPWESFTLRVPEAAVRGLVLGRRRSREPAETAARWTAVLQNPDKKGTGRKSAVFLKPYASTAGANVAGTATHTPVPTGIDCTQFVIVQYSV